MPIRPENRARYPKDWPAISLRIRSERAGWKCEGSPLYPDCRAVHGDPHPVTGGTVVLTVGHLDHTPENCADDNLKAWCQRCHNTYDMAMRRAGIAARARALAASPPSLPRQDQGWMPIESAPKDGTAILVTMTHSLGEGEWQNLQWVDSYCDAFMWPIFRERIDIPFPPTHWMPLPPPPPQEQAVAEIGWGSPSARLGRSVAA